MVKMRGRRKLIALSLLVLVRNLADPNGGHNLSMLMVRWWWAEVCSLILTNSASFVDAFLLKVERRRLNLCKFCVCNAQFTWYFVKGWATSGKAKLKAQRGKLYIAAGLHISFTPPYCQGFTIPSDHLLGYGRHKKCLIWSDWWRWMGGQPIWSVWLNKILFLMA